VTLLKTRPGNDSFKTKAFRFFRETTINVDATIWRRRRFKRRPSVFEATARGPRERTGSGARACSRRFALFDAFCSARQRKGIIEGTRNVEGCEVRRRETTATVLWAKHRDKGDKRIKQELVIGASGNRRAAYTNELRKYIRVFSAVRVREGGR